MTRYKYNL